MDDVIKELELGEIESTVFKELESINPNILKSLYLLSFGRYEGFDKNLKI